MRNVLLTVGCLAFSLFTTYLAYRLIQLWHRNEPPVWVVPFTVLVFISSVLSSAAFVGVYLPSSR